MFPAEKEGEWEPLKVREKTVRTQVAPPSEATDGISEERQYEEDPTSDEGAVYPLRNGKVVNWSCFYALLTHVYNTLSPPFHTPILVIAQPAWTQQDKEHLTQFFFEKFKTPAFALMDSAQSTLYAYSLQTATIIDVGHGKCDVTAITDFMTNDIGRGIAIPNSGGEAMTDRLLELLEPKGFNRDMADQLKKSSICEILPIGSPPPTEDGSNAPANPAAAASTGVTKSGPEASAPTNNIPRGPGPNTAAGEEEDAKAAGEDEGVLDIASILTSGKASEIIAKKEKEKAEKAAKKKGESDAAAAVAARQARLPNSQKIKAVLHYDEKRSEKELEANKRAHGVVDHSVVEPSDSAAAPGTAPAAAGEMVDSVQAQKDERKRVRDTSLYVRKEIEVGNERFQAADNGLLERIADAVHRCILSAPEAKSRSILWDSLIILGNGSKVKGMSCAYFTCQHLANVRDYRLQGGSRLCPQRQVPHTPFERYHVHV
jgi:actin-related protein 9